MAAYAVANIQITDPERYPEYRDRVAETVARYGGKYLVRGGKVDVLEGAWEPQRLVIIEFESVERCYEWYNSLEYAPLNRLRHEVAETNLVIVAGL
jgi:uncharacterized protein (DUF1330 family)